MEEQDWTAFAGKTLSNRLLVLRASPALGGTCLFDVREQKQYRSFFDAGCAAKNGAFLFFKMSKIVAEKSSQFRVSGSQFSSFDYAQDDG